jgi:hypothetical protein
MKKMLSEKRKRRQGGVGDKLSVVRRERKQRLLGTFSTRKAPGFICAVAREDGVRKERKIQSSVGG